MCKRVDGEKPESKTGSVSSTMLLFGTFGLMLTSAGTIGLHLYRLGKPDFLMDYHIPELTFAQCMSISGVCLVLMVLNIIHQLQQLKMVSLNIPVVPSPLPVLGHAINFLLCSPWDLLLGWHKQYGDIFTFSLMGRSMVSLGTPQDLKCALQSRISAVKKDVGFSYQPFLVILGKGIVTSEGQDWMKQRLKMSTTLRINVLDIIPSITLEAVQTLMAKLDKAAQDGATIELAESLRHLTLQVISKTFLSLSAEESDSNFAKLYLPIVDECNTRVWHPYRSMLFFLPFWWKHQTMVYRLNSYVSRLIIRRWNERMEEQRQPNKSGGVGTAATNASTRRKDILDLVLDSYQKDHPDATTMPGSDVRQIRDEFKTFMLAGHETSAAMMTWAFYELIANPTLYERLVDEGKEIFGTPAATKGAEDNDWSQKSGNDLPPRERLAELNYSEACLKESLRKYSVVPMVIRSVVAPLDLGNGRKISKGCTLVINIQAVHHNPTYWRDPMKFSPDRFLEKKPEPYTFLPFIEGPRNCLGQHLALLESKIVMALLAQRYEFQTATDAAGKMVTELGGDQDPRHRYIVPVVPGERFNIKVVRRK